MDWTELSFESWWELATGMARGWKGLEAEDRCCLRELIKFFIRPHPGTKE